MRTRKLITFLAVSATILALTTVSAYAACTDDASNTCEGTTDATLTLTSTGALSISVPASTVDLGSTAIPTAATNFESSLGDVIVDDQRGALIDTGNLWTVSATGTDFCIDTDTTNDTENKVYDCDTSDSNLYFDNAFVIYDPGTVSLVGGIGDLNSVSVGTPSNLSVGATVTYTALSGNSKVTWNPTLTFPVTATHVAGTYGGTITHSVV